MMTRCELIAGFARLAAVADGTYVNPQNSQLTTVSVLTPMWINFSISENEMERIRNEVRSGDEGKKKRRWRGRKPR